MISFFAAAFLAFSVVGCALFTGGGDEEAEMSQEEDSDFMEDEGGEGAEDYDEEGEDEAGEDEDGEDYDGEEGDYDEEEGDADGEEGYEEEEADGGEKKKGFFARLFDWSDDDDEEVGEDEESFDGEEDYDFDEESEGDDFGDSADSEDEGAAYDEAGEGESAPPEESPVDEAGEPTSGEPASGEQEGAVATGAEESEDVSKEDPPQFIPLRKTLRAAYRKGAHLVNAVYIAREGDDIASVSQKIYNEDRSAALYEINSHLRNRAVKVGDKIYYSSKIRPGDSSRLLVYYEEAGVPPATRTLMPGENIRAVSMKLLGHPKSWKEIWATNPDIVSKGLISQAVEIKYWPRALASSPPPPAPEPDLEGAGAPPAAEDTGFVDEGAEGIELGPGEDDGKAAAEDEGGPFADSPPEEKPEEKQESLPPPAGGSAGGSGGEAAGEWLIYLVGLLLIALSAGMLIVKKRRKSQDFDYTATGIQQLS